MKCQCGNTTFEKIEEHMQNAALLLTSVPLQSQLLSLADNKSKTKTLGHIVNLVFYVFD